MNQVNILWEYLFKCQYFIKQNCSLLWFGVYIGFVVKYISIIIFFQNAFVINKLFYVLISVLNNDIVIVKDDSYYYN